MQTLRFCNFLSENMDAVYQALCAHLSRQLGVSITAVRGQHFDDFKTGQADIGIICAYPFSEFLHTRPDELHLLGAPVITGLSNCDWPAYHSVLLTSTDHAADRVDACFGQTIAFNEVVSHSGFRVMADYLDQRDLDYRAFSHWQQSGSHANSLQQLQDGQASLAAIDFQVWQRACVLDPDLAKRFRVLDTTTPRPNTPFVASARVPESLRHAIQYALLDLTQSKDGQAILDSAAQQSIRAVSPEAYHVYQDLHAVVARVFSGSTLAKDSLRAVLG